MMKNTTEMKLKWVDNPSLRRFDIKPIYPQPDNDKLAATGSRLILRFPTGWIPGDPVRTVLVSKAVLTEGWVIGVMP